LIGIALLFVALVVGVFALIGKEEPDRGEYWGVYIDLEEGPGCAMNIQRSVEVLFKCVLI